LQVGLFGAARELALADTDDAGFVFQTTHRVFCRSTYFNL
jgi:hypothetical protein